jgi:hypothetical protein
MSNPYVPYTAEAAGELAALKPAIPLHTPVLGSQLIFSGECLLVGWSVRNTDAAAGHIVILLDGTDASGMPVGYSKPASTGGADTQSPSPPGLLMRNGVYFQDASGFVECVIWIVPL